MIADYSEYRGACFEEDGKEVYVVERGGADVLLIPRLEATGEILQCEFETLDPTLSYDDVQALVYVVLLGNFLRRYYLGKVKYVNFKNMKSGEGGQTVYLG